MKNVVNALFQYVRSLLFDPSMNTIVAVLLLLFETVFTVVIIQNVPYTEIDWIAYMQEVETFIVNGTTDYSAMVGNTGPCVYPAGFVYIYSVFYYITNKGNDVRCAQYVFAALYVLFLGLVFRLCKRFPPYVLILMSITSYRIHSIFVLRLFNDPIAMALFYVALNLFITNRWTLGSIFYSLAVSVKMNVLLFAPALLLIYLSLLGIKRTILQLFLCGIVQLLLGLPFLLTHPIHYVKAAFDLGRVFMHKWTVNYRFLPEYVFVHPGFHITLLSFHLITLGFCAYRYWRPLLARKKSRKDAILSSMFMCNFIGIVFSRSLHYQFYVWYYHQLYYLCWSSTHFSVTLKLLILGLVEMAWNTYPSTIFSSAILHVSHFVLLVGNFIYFEKLLYKTSEKVPRKQQ